MLDSFSMHSRDYQDSRSSMLGPLHRIYLKEDRFFASIIQAVYLQAMRVDCHWTVELSINLCHCVHNHPKSPGRAAILTEVDLHVQSLQQMAR